MAGGALSPSVCPGEKLGLVKTCIPVCKNGGVPPQMPRPAPGSTSALAEEHTRVCLQCGQHAPSHRHTPGMPCASTHAQTPTRQARARLKPGAGNPFWVSHCAPRSSRKLNSEGGQPEQCVHCLNNHTLQRQSKRERCGGGEMAATAMAGPKPGAQSISLASQGPAGAQVTRTPSTAFLSSRS